VGFQGFRETPYAAIDLPVNGGYARRFVLSPRSLRHAVTTVLLETHPLHVVQDFCDHANPAATTPSPDPCTAPPPTASSPG
jgi:integrase